MTPNESKIINIFVFVQLVYFLNRLGVRMVANNQRRLNSSKLLNECSQTPVGKWLTIVCKTSKMSKFWYIFVIFVELLFEIGKLRYDKSFEKLQKIKLGPTRVIQNYLTFFMVESFLRTTQILQKLRIFKFFETFSGSFLLHNF